MEGARGGTLEGMEEEEEEEEEEEKQRDAQHAVCWCRCRPSNLICATRLSKSVSLD